MSGAGRTLVLLALVTLATPSGGACGGGASGLPGAEPPSEALARRLAEALAAKGRGYRPRTRHLRQDGSPAYTNRLILETSPYLLQHAHNPVDWFPWGEEAFAAARRLGRPVLLSIGYSTCHWCHVMEEESFEDEEIAAFLNANYVAIKVDREERPDVDGVYMTAVQMLTGGGGWPMTVWLTPDRRPYYGGTYFPPRDGARGARKGLLTLLGELAAAYRDEPDQIAARSREIADRIQAAMAPEPGPAAEAEASLKSAMRTYRTTFDPKDGGRAGAPKFPSNLPLRLLLWRHARTAEPDLLEMADRTLRKMAAGGIYDHVGGGFHRYATDEKWLVPHFEKMLYDNALLAVAYLEAYQLTRDEDFARVAREILRYVAREMTAPDGGFCSATDADSLDPEGEREEGRFFTWTPAELREVLGAEGGARFAAYYGVTEAGNFEGRSILHVSRPLAEVAAELGVPAERLEVELAGARDKLYAARARRPAPLRDDKVVTAWNGLMISAMAQGGFVLGDPEALAHARRAAEFILARVRVEGRLRRTWSGGAARHPACLEDYAFLIAGLVDLYEASGEGRWLAEAIALQGELDEHYRDPAGGYFMTAGDHEALIAREKPSYDGAEPSGNSVALMNLLRLSAWTGQVRYREAAEQIKSAFAGLLARRPTAVPEMLLAITFDSAAPKEVAIVAPASRVEAAPLVDVLRRTFVPGKVFAVVTEAEAGEQGERVPLLRDKVARGGRATAYVCERGVCKLPTSDPAILRAQLTPAAD